MEKQITVWLSAVLLLAVLNCSEAQLIPTYFEVGGNVTLRPTVTGTITNILWKYNGNLLAEWVQDEVDLYYYNQYIGRTTLNTATGHLEIEKMAIDDVGTYTIEINNKVHGQSYDVKWITRVPTPTVEFKPLTCGKDSESCTVSCEGQEPESLSDAEPIQHSWKMGEKDWVIKTKDITVTSAQTKEEHIKTITCRMKNPVSQEDSKPKENPLFKVKVSKPTVVFRLTCGNDSESCSVICDVKEPENLRDAEPIECSWRMGEKNWETMTIDINITSADTANGKTIFSRLKNPVSQEESELLENPLFKVKPEVWKVHLRLSLHAVFWVFIGCVLLITRSNIRKLICPRQDKTSLTT